MSKRISVFYTVTVLSLFLSGAAVLLIAAQDMETVSIDSTVPDIEAYSIEGLPVSFHPPEGKTLLVQFMKSNDERADECIRDLIVLYGRFRESGLLLLCVFMDTDEDQVVRFSTRWQVPWAQVLDSDVDEERPSQVFGVKEIPANFLVDSNGKILALNLTGESAHDAIAEQLNVSLDSLPVPEAPSPISEGGPGSRNVVMTTAPSVPSVPKVNLLGTKKEREEAEACKENLRKISLAIASYKQDHNGEPPNWLHDLFPQYLQDENVLLCPSDPTHETRFAYLIDKKMKCGYLYEFAPAPNSTGWNNQPWRDWKKSQLHEYGDKTPLVGCYHHSRKLNLSYGGEIYFSSEVWENDFPQGSTINDPDAKTRKKMMDIAVALDRYKKEKKTVPDELKDLYPKYIRNETFYLCPATNESFSYQFSKQSGLRDWKKEQLKIYGGYVPIVRARGALKNGNVINLAYNGEIYESPSVWETLFIRDSAAIPKAAAADRKTTSTRSTRTMEIARAEAEMRILSNALECFFIDNNTYLLPLEGQTIDKAGIKIGSGSRARYLRLTTPVAYISTIPKDPFSKESNAYRYHSDGKNFYILASDGPDRKIDFDLKKYDLSKGSKKEDLTPFTYHPSNGLTSQGDLFRVGP